MEHTSPYKTAEELGIENWERDGLVALVGPLSRCELKFDMATWPNLAMQHKCGCAACIGGNLEVITDRNVVSNQALDKLFYPPKDRIAGRLHPAWRASQAQGAAAIVNFLTLGDPCWDDVMREAA